MAERELTGNHYLSFPEIERRSASVTQVTALHSGLAGLLAWSGEPLLRPELEVDGKRLDLGGLRWERLDRWIPRASGPAGEECRVTLTVCAPAGYDPLVRGACIEIEVSGRVGRVRTARATLHVHWRGTDLHVRSGRPLPGDFRLAGRAGDAGVALEAGRVPFGAALALAGGDRAARCLAGVEGGELLGRAGDWECGGQPGRALVARLVQEGRIEDGHSARFVFYLALGRDRDSALATAAQLGRIGPDGLLRRARLALSQLARRAEDPGLNEVLNRNLLFNHFFGVGRGLDDDRLHAVTSRSPFHGATASVNEREALLWTLPALTLGDPLLARELLVHFFEAFSGAPAQPARYLDGGILAPGFVLDHLLAYPLALDRYATEAQDGAILSDPMIQDVLREIDNSLFGRLHREALLAETELLDTADAADFPYPTFGNVLLWCYCRALERIWRAEKGEPRARFEGAAEEVAAAIWQRCTVDVGGAPVLASSTDLEGEAAVYDAPNASLVALPYLGFCEAEDPIWRNSMELLRSASYPLWLGGASYPGLAGRGDPAGASLAALAAELLGPYRSRALALLRSLRLTDDVACDLYDPNDGGTAAGPHAAAVAGLLAWALDRGAPAAVKPRRKR